MIPRTRENFDQFRPVFGKCGGSLNAQKAGVYCIRSGIGSTLTVLFHRCRGGMLIMAPSMEIPQVSHLSYHRHRRYDPRNSNYTYFESQESRKCIPSLLSSLWQLPTPSIACQASRQCLYRAHQSWLGRVGAKSVPPNTATLFYGHLSVRRFNSLRVTFLRVLIETN